jgi:SAM-dependent methyltransferase
MELMSMQIGGQLGKRKKPEGVVDFVKARTPWAIRHLSRRIKRQIRWVRSAKQPVRSVFREIYQQNLWGGERPGSDSHAASLYAEGIKAFIANRHVGSIVDLGCGDFQVASKFLHDAVSYVGVDIVEPLVASNIAKYYSDKVSFTCLDIVEDPLPGGELCLIREVFQHLSNAEILKVLPKLLQFKFVIYTDYQPGLAAPCSPNRDIAHGVDIRIWRDSALFLDKPPFNVPMQLLFEAPASTILRNPGERIRTYLLWP